ncbi:symmetrical bis(5'-nucleosyl)-tetraphosphatase [Aurantivibrio plasticivorans]
MATYAIGDIQGCYDSFMALLDKLAFDPSQDELWLCGDLVNRGPGSLETLRFIVKHQQSIRAVLGNHDLHMLAVAYGSSLPKNKDSLDAVLDAPDSEELLDWVQHLPLVYRCKNRGYLMVHAGIPPIWSTKDAMKHAAEVEAVLQGPKFPKFLNAMYGNIPDKWNDSLEGMARLRTITNYFTRMRVCQADGRLDLVYKGPAANAPQGYLPWFEHTPVKPRKETILFGHWASLEGKVFDQYCIALDTGCVWGGELSAYCLETGAWTRQRAID